MKTKTLYLFIFLVIILLPSCKTQCQILEEQIDLCKTYLNCDNEEDVICKEVDNAYKLISIINDKISEGTDDKVQVEKACSYAIGKITVGNCIDAQDNLDKEWEIEGKPDDSIKNIMSSFGISSSIDKINPTINLKTEISKNPKLKNSKDEELTCGDKILDEYKNSQENEKEIRISILKTSSLSEFVSIMQINPSSSNSNVFIGDKYIKNANSPCDFNKGGRLLGGKDNDYDYKYYDYVFCSKSSGWLSETESTQSNCALTRQEVFLINWDKDYFTEWCSKIYRKNNCTRNDYICISDANDFCYELREDFLCENNFTTSETNCQTEDKNCQESFDKCEENLDNCKTNSKNSFITCKGSENNSNCKNRCLIDKYIETNDNLENLKVFKETFYKCLNYNVCNVHKENDTEKCNCGGFCENGGKDSLECIACNQDCIYSCIKNDEIDLSSYKNNITYIENCFYEEIKNLSEDTVLKNSIAENETLCSDSCEYDTCIYSCLEENCSNYECFENSTAEKDYFDKDTCKKNSCYYNCQKKCDPLEINESDSHVITFYREVEDEITGSNCNNDEVFTDNKDYCVIEYDILNKEGE